MTRKGGGECARAGTQRGGNQSRPERFASFGGPGCSAWIARRWRDDRGKSRCVVLCGVVARFAERAGRDEGGTAAAAAAAVAAAAATGRARQRRRQREHRRLLHEGSRALWAPLIAHTSPLLLSLDPLSTFLQTSEFLLPQSTRASSLARNAGALSSLCEGRPFDARASLLTNTAAPLLPRALGSRSRDLRDPLGVAPSRVRPGAVRRTRARERGRDRHHLSRSNQKGLPHDLGARRPSALVPPRSQGPTSASPPTWAAQ